MRIVILGVTAASLLASGIALSLQATRAPSEPLEATREPSEATAAAPVVASFETTPFEFRQIRTVPVIEPQAAPKAPIAAPAETRRTDYYEVEAAPRAEPEENRAPAKRDPKMPEAVSRPRSVAALSDKPTDEGTTGPKHLKEEVSPSGRSFGDPSHARNRDWAEGKHSGARPKRRATAVKEDPAPTPPAALAYDGSNENHSPFHSLGKLLSGAH
jgi:hypothetical protein